MTKDNSQPDENQELRRIIPFLKNWQQLYAFVLGELALLILLFYIITRYYA